MMRHWIIQLASQHRGLHHLISESLKSPALDSISPAAFFAIAVDKGPESWASKPATAVEARAPSESVPL